MDAFGANVLRVQTGNPIKRQLPGQKARCFEELWGRWGMILATIQSSRVIHLFVAGNCSATVLTWLRTCSTLAIDSISVAWQRASGSDRPSSFRHVWRSRRRWPAATPCRSWFPSWPLAWPLGSTSSASCRPARRYRRCSGNVRSSVVKPPQPTGSSTRRSRFPHRPGRGITAPSHPVDRRYWSSAPHTPTAPHPDRGSSNSSYQSARCAKLITYLVHSIGYAWFHCIKQ